MPFADVFDRLGRTKPACLKLFADYPYRLIEVYDGTLWVAIGSESSIDFPWRPFHHFACNVNGKLGFYFIVFCVCFLFGRFQAWNPPRRVPMPFLASSARKVAGAATQGNINAGRYRLMGWPNGPCGPLIKWLLIHHDPSSMGRKRPLSAQMEANFKSSPWVWKAISSRFGWTG